MTFELRSEDYGVDVTLHEVAAFPDSAGRKIYADTGYALDIQLKSTTTAVVGDDVVKWYLKTKDYDKLRPVRSTTPRILVLFVLEETEEQRLRQTEEALCLRHCCYWVSLAGRGAVGNPSRTLIELPRKNVFSVDGLREIMRRVKGKESL